MTAAAIVTAKLRMIGKTVAGMSVIIVFWIHSRHGLDSSTGSFYPAHTYGDNCASLNYKRLAYGGSHVVVANHTT